MSRLQMIMPEHVFMNHDIHGQCVSGVPHHFVHVTKTNGCNFKIEKQMKPRVVRQGTNRLYCTDFVVKNVTATCEYTCGSAHLRETKQVVVTGMHVRIYY